MGYSGEGMVPILKRLGDNICGVEIGVCRGENIRGLLSACDNIADITGIDPWLPYGDVTKEMQAENYRKTASILLPYVVMKQARILKGQSLGKVVIFENESLDFVYIDGDHSALAAYADMKAWWPKVKPGGVLAGHDYRPKDKTVRAAVKQFSDEMELEIHTTEFYSWYFKK